MVVFKTFLFRPIPVPVPFAKASLGALSSAARSATHRVGILFSNLGKTWCAASPCRETQDRPAAGVLRLSPLENAKYLLRPCALHDQAGAR
jgi:hypothetical protein